jgi:hypothetical protein
MLGFILSGDPAEMARMIADLARDLQDMGLRLAGAVELPDDPAIGRRQMRLRLLGRDEVVDIAQNLGALARGCTLDTAALEDAAGRAEAVFGFGCDLVIINKFGKTEAEGRGFRPLIGRAVAAGVPVLIGLSPDRRAAFEAFSGGMGQAVVPDARAILNRMRAAA